MIQSKVLCKCKIILLRTLQNWKKLLTPYFLLKTTYPLYFAKESVRDERSWKGFCGTFTKGRKYRADIWCTLTISSAAVSSHQGKYILDKHVFFAKLIDRTNRGNWKYAHEQQQKNNNNYLYFKVELPSGVNFSKLKWSLGMYNIHRIMQVENKQFFTSCANLICHVHLHIHVHVKSTIDYPTLIRLPATCSCHLVWLKKMTWCPCMQDKAFKFCA